MAKLMEWLSPRNGQTVHWEQCFPLVLGMKQRISAHYPEKLSWGKTSVPSFWWLS